jgi:hypothetical protein
MLGAKWINQNEKLNGTYINFVSKEKNKVKKIKASSVNDVLCFLGKGVLGLMILGKERV